MRILSGLDLFRTDPAKPLVLALGNFDGIHLGHQRVLNKVLQDARSAKGIAAVFTFREHPQQVLNPSVQPQLLSSVPQKIFILNRLGIDCCFLVSFTQDFSKLEPEEFVRKILVERLNVRKVYLGFNARFGRDRNGDSALMKKMSEKFNFEFEQVEPVKLGGDLVSSSRIRNLVQTGKFKEASECLGRPFAIFRKVIRGDGRGKTLGYPTANLEMSGQLLPPEGVYPVNVRIMEEKTRQGASEGIEEIHFEEKSGWLAGVLNFGTRPTFNKEEKTLEVHILEFDRPLYGLFLEIIFHPRLRSERTFDGVEALKDQIRKDIAQTRSYFAGSPV